MRSAAAFLAVCFTITGAGTAALADTPALKAEVEACQADPANKIGGAAIGECLEDRSLELDAEIAGLMELSMRKLCQEADRRILRGEQAAWTARRSQQCDLISRSPGNTASYINGASCLVMQAHQRIDQLAFFNEYASPFCFDFFIDDASSVPGEVPMNQPRPIRGTKLRWSLDGDVSESVLNVRSGEADEPIASLPLDCNFCSGDADNCAADGIYVLGRGDESEAPAIFAVCHKGAHSQTLKLLDPTRTKSELRFEMTGDYYLEWAIKDGQLQVTPDGKADRMDAWPAY